MWQRLRKHRFLIWKTTCEPSGSGCPSLWNRASGSNALCTRASLPQQARTKVKQATGPVIHSPPRRATFQRALLHQGRREEVNSGGKSVLQKQMIRNNIQLHVIIELSYKSAPASTFQIETVKNEWHSSLDPGPKLYVSCAADFDYSKIPSAVWTRTPVWM